MWQLPEMGGGGGHYRYMQGEQAHLLMHGFFKGMQSNGSGNCVAPFVSMITAGDVGSSLATMGRASARVVRALASVAWQHSWYQG